MINPRSFLSRPGKCNAGFTRTELLVIVASIVVLLALLAVVLPRAKDYRNQNACDNNLRRIGGAMSQYAQEHENKYPSEWNNKPNASESEADDSSPTGAWCIQGFDAVLQPYLGPRQLFVCPADMWLKRNLSTWGRRNTWDDTSYGINVLLPRKLVTSVAQPSATILLGHTRFEHTLWEDHRGNLWNTHRNGDTYLFCDGSVQFLSGPDTFHPRNLWVPGKLR